MANKTIDELTAATTPLNGDEPLHIVQGGNSRRATVDEVRGLKLKSISDLSTAAGDLIYGLGTGLFARLPKGTAGQSLRMNAAATAPEWRNTGPIIHVRDEKSPGTDGGTFSLGDWRTRDLNTVVTNDIEGAGLASNRVTLPPGTYRCQGFAAAGFVRRHVARLQNITDGTTLIVGSAGYVDNLAVNTISILDGKFALAITSVLEIQHYCDLSRSSNGFGTGSPSGSGVNGVFVSVIFEQV